MTAGGTQEKYFSAVHGAKLEATERVSTSIVQARDRGAARSRADNPVAADADAAAACVSKLGGTVGTGTGPWDAVSSARRVLEDSRASLTLVLKQQAQAAVPRTPVQVTFPPDDPSWARRPQETDGGGGEHSDARRDLAAEGGGEYAAHHQGRENSPETPNARPQSVLKSSGRPEHNLSEEYPSSVPTETLTRPNPRTPAANAGNASFDSNDGEMSVMRDRIESDRLAEKLRAGGVFVKHGRRGWPHRRHVWCTQDLAEVRWKDPKKKGATASGSVRVSQLKNVVVGRKTDIARRASRGKGEGYFLSLLFDDRTVDLEVLETSARSDWIKAFQWLIQRNSARSSGNAW